MKKFWTMVCMIACIFGLTACGEEATLTEYEQQKVDYARQLAAKGIVPMLLDSMDEESARLIEGYTMEEVEYVIGDQQGINVDGYAFTTALESFRSATEAMGNIISIQEVEDVTARIDGKQIIVDVEVTGERKSATAEIILSNDMFMRMESAALNPISSFGELMGKAGLNTLIGMGTVFVVLILISLIISCFGVIPKIQAGQAAKKAAKAAGTGTEKAIDNVVAQIIDQEEGTDDCELVAVIAAAVAAYEGAGSTDGFVVRSIRRR